MIFCAPIKVHVIAIFTRSSVSQRNWGPHLKNVVSHVFLSSCALPFFLSFSSVTMQDMILKFWRTWALMLFISHQWGTLRHKSLQHFITIIPTIKRCWIFRKFWLCLELKEEWKQFISHQNIQTIEQQLNPLSEGSLITSSSLFWFKSIWKNHWSCSRGNCVGICKTLCIIHWRLANTTKQVFRDVTLVPSEKKWQGTFCRQQQKHIFSNQRKYL